MLRPIARPAAGNSTPRKLPFTCPPASCSSWSGPGWRCAPTGCRSTVAGSSGRPWRSCSPTWTPRATRASWRGGCARIDDRAPPAGADPAVRGPPRVSRHWHAARTAWRDQIASGGSAASAASGGAAADPSMTSVVTGETGDAPQTRPPGGFEVHLDVFGGPFDLLLALISKHKLDITEIALSSVTDEFISHIRALADGWDLDQASYFLVVAATLLDLKAARLLPAGEVDDEEDLALLEARDLLFARLLQYRAYKEAAAVLAGKMALQARRFARRVPVEARFAQLLPEVLLGLGPAEFAAIAARTLAPRPVPVVSTEHIHTPQTSVREQAGILSRKLGLLGRATFRRLTSDCAGTYEVVARFLALLELYREGSVSFEQVTPLGELHVSWSALPGAGIREPDGAASGPRSEEDD